MIFSKLKEILRDRGITITALSNQTGISRTTLTSLAHNTGNGIQYDTLNVLCKYFGITPKDLFIYLPFDFDYVCDFDSKCGTLIISEIYKDGAIYPPPIPFYTEITIDVFTNEEYELHQLTIELKENTVMYQSILDGLSENTCNAFTNLLSDNIQKKYLEYIKDKNIKPLALLRNFQKITALDLYRYIHTDLLNANLLKAKEK